MFRGVEATPSNPVIETPDARAVRLLAEVEALARLRSTAHGSEYRDGRADMAKEVLAVLEGHDPSGS